MSEFFVCIRYEIVKVGVFVGFVVRVKMIIIFFVGDLE